MNNKLYGNLIFELSKEGRKGYSLPRNNFGNYEIPQALCRAEEAVLPECDELLKTGRFKLAYDKPFFNEFYVKYDGDVDTLYQRFIEAGFLAVRLEDGLLFAVTEKRTKEEIDNLVKIAAL